ncbi:MULTISPECIES: hypothetical protein [Bacillus cereus group]|uniref:Uncharacterized protein n=1 Tax=Bacillus thuringiensis TaxID=1428 RepID=A0AB33B642_BACTU|nr:hypothetical protein [Bacillus thuringiensis]AJG79456.1 hypothetical protein BF38_5436 [Bacillus thuringiensis]MCU5430300.1 hypothetical protein [Bacillus cereus]
MKYENFEVLGSYSVREGGYINFSMGKNLELGTEINTYIHELFHMYLTNCSNLGFLLLLFERECSFALEAEDELHYNKIRELSEMIFNRTIDVQEIYANNQELLWIEDKFDADLKRKSFEHKPKKYQDYCNEMSVITNNENLNNGEKRYWIEKICLHALNIQISSDEFLNALKSRQKLDEYFSEENHPKTRLNIALGKYCRNENFEEAVEVNPYKFFSKIKDLGIIKHFNMRLPGWDQIATIMNNKDILNQINIKEFNELTQKRMDEKVKLFDFYNLQVEEVDDISDHLDFGVFAIKNCENLTNKENFYFITETSIDTIPSYVSDQAPYHFLSNPEIKVIGISSNEFDIINMKPSYIDIKETPVVVLVESYTDAKEIINKILLEGELYIGDLYDQSMNNFSTVLFFRERTEPKIIFVFPTLKKLLIRLVKELGIESVLVYSNNEQFIKTISVFGNEVELLKFARWIFSFILKSSCRFTVLEDSATKMSFDLTKLLSNVIMKIRIPDYYNKWAALPTKKTVGEPYYALMEFDNENNTGAFKAINEKTIIFFYNKSDALNHKKSLLKNKSMSDKLEVVGIDRHYWNAVKKHFLDIHLNIFICYDARGNIGELIDLKKLDGFINNTHRV